jgi:hypothetical protein
MKDTTIATDVRCVLATIVPLTVVVQAEKVINQEKVTSLVKVISPEKVAINLVLATIAKAAINKEKAGIVQDTIVKAVISPKKAISLVKDAPTKVHKEEVIGVVTPNRERQREAIVLATTSVLVLQATILMLNIA